MRTISLCASLLAVAITAIGSAEPLFEQVDVFTAGTEGYHTFPIPAIVTVADGSLIALAEGRNRESNYWVPGNVGARHAARSSRSSSRLLNIRDRTHETDT